MTVATQVPADQVGVDGAVTPDQLSHIDSLVHVLGQETVTRSLRCFGDGREVRELTRREAGAYILLLRVLAGEG